MDFQKLLADSKLTKKQRTIAAFVLDDPVGASYLTLKDFAAAAGTTEVTAIKFCHALGFEGFTDFRTSLQQYASEVHAMPAFENASDARFAEEIADVCAEEMNNLRTMAESLDVNELHRFCGRLLTAKEVIIFAHDASYIFAEYLAYRLRFLRVNATSISIGNTDSLQSSLARLDGDGQAVFLSYPPYHQPMRSLVEFCLMKGIPTAALTDSEESPVAQKGVQLFRCPTGARYYYNSQVATTSFVNIITSGIAFALGDKFAEILEEEQDVSNFVLTSR